MLSKSMNNRIGKPIKQIIQSIDEVKEQHINLKEVCVYLKKITSDDNNEYQDDDLDAESQLLVIQQVLAGIHKDTKKCMSKLFGQIK